MRIGLKALKTSSQQFLGRASSNNECFLISFQITSVRSWVLLQIGLCQCLFLTFCHFVLRPLSAVACFFHHFFEAPTGTKKACPAFSFCSYFHIISSPTVPHVLSQTLRFFRNNCKSHQLHFYRRNEASTEVEI